MELDIEKLNQEIEARKAAQNEAENKKAALLEEAKSLGIDVNQFVKKSEASAIKTEEKQKENSTKELKEKKVTSSETNKKDDLETELKDIEKSLANSIASSVKNVLEENQKENQGPTKELHL